MKNRYLFFCLLCLNSAVLWGARRTPVVDAYFRPGDGYIPYFHRDMTYKETWDNIAQRYLLNKEFLLGFNRVRNGGATIQLKRLFIPLLFNVNLFATNEKGQQDNFLSMPVYYTIRRAQRVLDLAEHFREPMLSFVKKINGLEDQNVLSPNSVVLIGYLRINASVGWDRSVDKDAEDYKDYADVQREMRVRASLFKMQQYKVKEQSLILTRESLRSDTVAEVGGPTDKVAKDIIASIDTKGLMEQNRGFSNYMKRERIQAMDRRPHVHRYLIPAKMREKAGSAEPAYPGGERALALPEASERIPISTASFFRREYDEELSAAQSEHVSNARVKQFQLAFDETDGKFYGLMNGVAPSAIVKIVSYATRKTIYVKIISATPESTEDNAHILVLSEKAVKALGIRDNDAVSVYSPQ